MHRDLLMKIENGMPSFSKGQRAIAAFILENYDRAVYMSAASVGAEVGVSESTVVRFATTLGFDGYPDLQRTLSEVVRMNLSSVKSTNLIDENDVLSVVLTADADRILRTLSGIDRDSFDRTVDKLISAKKIYIIGARSSAFLASIFHYNLGLITDSALIIGRGSDGETLEGLFRVEDGDVVVAVDLLRHSAATLKSVRFARSKGAEVIVLTDKANSPIAKEADEILATKTRGDESTGSFAAPLSVINAIIEAMIRKKENEYSSTRAQLEEIWEKYNVYDKNR